MVLPKEKVKKSKKYQSQTEMSAVSSKSVVKDLQKKCKAYYKNSRKKYYEYFLNCVEEIQALQPSGFACMQARRYFIVGVLPQFCVIPDPLTKKEREIQLNE